MDMFIKTYKVHLKQNIAITKQTLNMPFVCLNLFKPKLFIQAVKTIALQ